MGPQHIWYEFLWPNFKFPDSNKRFAIFSSVLQFNFSGEFRIPQVVVLMNCILSINFNFPDFSENLKIPDHK